MQTDRMLARPIEQCVSIANANPGVIAASTRVTAIDDPLGSRESLLDGNLTTLQEGEHPVGNARVVVEISSGHPRPVVSQNSHRLRVAARANFAARTRAVEGHRARPVRPRPDRRGRSSCQYCLA